MSEALDVGERVMAEVGGGEGASPVDSISTAPFFGEAGWGNSPRLRSSAIKPKAAAIDPTATSAMIPRAWRCGLLAIAARG